MTITPVKISSPIIESVKVLTEDDFPFARVINGKVSALWRVLNKEGIQYDFLLVGGDDGWILGIDGRKDTQNPDWDYDIHSGESPYVTLHVPNFWSYKPVWVDDVNEILPQPEHMVLEHHLPDKGIGMVIRCKCGWEGTTTHMGGKHP